MCSNNIVMLSALSLICFVIFFKTSASCYLTFVFRFVKMASFVSQNKLNEARAVKRKLQEEVLNTAKSDFAEKQAIAERKKEYKQDQWVTSSLENRLKVDAVKAKSTHKHKKSHKKHKKKSKKSHASSSEECEEEKWIEKKSIPLPEQSEINEDFLKSIPTYSSADIRLEKTKQETDMKTKELSCFDKPGQHAKELNPFWKSGGNGLPTSQSTSKNVGPSADWLERSLKRMQEQSAESGRSLESIASERYGSLQAFQSLLDKARGKSSTFSSKSKFMKPSDHHITVSKKHDKKSYDNSAPRWKKKTGDLQAMKPDKLENAPRWKKKTGDLQAMKPDKLENTNVDNAATKPKTSSNELKLSKQCDENEKTGPTLLSEAEKNKISARILKAELSGNATLVEKLKKSLEDSKNAEQQANPSKSQLQNPTPDCPSQTKILSEEEKNRIGAKIIKAELMGNSALIEKLKKKLEDSKIAESTLAEQNKNDEQKSDIENNSDSSNASDEETVVLLRTSKTGQAWPVTGSDDFVNHKQKRRKKNKLPMHNKDGEREKYFADDDRYSLRDLVEQEKTGASDNSVEVMSRLNAKAFTKAGGDTFTLDDMFEAEAGKFSSSSMQNRQQDIARNKKHMRRLENCRLCFGNRENPKHLVIAVGRVAYLKLPSHKVLQKGHCVLAPMHHSATGTNLDEDVWDEIRKFMQSLCNMFKNQEKDCVFLQTCFNLHRSPHFYIECIPLPIELGDVAPIYFKKAIQECESEWSQNKKLVDTRGKSVKDKIPKGLPYFAVDFGLTGGFAHVIEEEGQFPIYFGREILGGMLDADPYLWRKPKEESFGEQMKRSIEFEKQYKTFDWTSTELH